MNFLRRLFADMGNALLDNFESFLGLIACIYGVVRTDDTLFYVIGGALTGPIFVRVYFITRKP